MNHFVALNHFVTAIKNFQESTQPAVLPTESIHVTIENAPKTKESGDGHLNGSKAGKTTSMTPTDSAAPVMRNVELTPSTERIQEGFGRQKVQMNHILFNSIKLFSQSMAK